MTGIVQWLDAILIEDLHINQNLAGFINTAILIAAMIFIGIGVNLIVQRTFRWLSRHNIRIVKSKWHPYISKRRIGHHVLLIIPGILLYFLPYLAFGKDSEIIRLLHRADIIYLLIVMIMTGNAILLAFLDFYSTTDNNRNHPLHGLVQGLQVMLYFVGGIIIVAVLIDKSPKVLLTGLGASAAILMLVFKDSILGFVAGVQLSQNNMVKLGDWIQMPDGSANGNVEEITLNSVKVRNWDNTITMIPPYTLTTTPFKNWRGMQESGGRRVDKRIFIDMTSMEMCSDDMISDIRKSVPLMDRWFKLHPKELEKDTAMTNVQLYRIYMEQYLRNNPEVNQSLDLIITQKESTAYGLPVEVYFFLEDKRWASYEKKQSDIFDHLMTMASEFGLRLYQRP